MDRIVAFVSNQPEALPAALAVDAEQVDGTQPPSSRWFSVFHQRGEPLLRQRSSSGAPDGTTATMLADLRAENVLLLSHQHQPREPECDNIPLRFGSWSCAVAAAVATHSEELLQLVPDFLRHELGGTSEARGLFGIALNFIHTQTHLHASQISLQILAAAMKHALSEWARLCHPRENQPVVLALQHADSVAVGALGCPVRAIRRVGLQRNEDRAKLLAHPLAAKSVQADRLRYIWICADDQLPAQWQSWRSPNGAIVAADRRTELVVQEW